MKSSRTLILCTALLFTSCIAQKSVYQLSGEWRVSSLGGSSVSESEDAPFIGFDTNQSLIYGFTGCNRITGTIDASALVNGKADFSQIGMTRMLCQDSKYERPLMDALQKATSSEITDNTMTLKDKDGKTLLTLTKQSSNGNSR